MSQCDYILGPFSTFTLWASFIGETKFHHIFLENETIKLERFRVFRGNWLQGITDIKKVAKELIFNDLTVLPNMDSNHDTQNQNLMYYPYTIGQFSP